MGSRNVSYRGSLTDEQLRRVKKSVRELRERLKPLNEATLRAERLTAEDYAITILPCIRPPRNYAGRR